MRKIRIPARRARTKQMKTRTLRTLFSKSTRTTRFTPSRTGSTVTLRSARSLPQIRRPFRNWSQQPGISRHFSVSIWQIFSTRKRWMRLRLKMTSRVWSRPTDERISSPFQRTKRSHQPGSHSGNSFSGHSKIDSIPTRNSSRK